MQQIIKLIPLIYLFFCFSLFAQVTEVNYLDYKRNIIGFESNVIDTIHNYENKIKLTKGKAHGLLRIDSPRGNKTLASDTITEYYVYYRIEYDNISSTQKGHRFNKNVSFGNLFSSDDSIALFIYDCLNKIDDETFERFLTDSFGFIPSTKPVLRITETKKVFWSRHFPIAMDILDCDLKLCIRVSSEIREDCYIYTGEYYEEQEIKRISYVDTVFWNDTKDSITAERIYVRHPYEVTSAYTLSHSTIQLYIDNDLVYEKLNLKKYSFRHILRDRMISFDPIYSFTLLNTTIIPKIKSFKNGYEIEHKLTFDEYGRITNSFEYTLGKFLGGFVFEYKE